jgi:uncharacterized damage-inducible protein DinB
MVPITSQSICSQIAKQVRDAYTGGNWTGVSLKETLEGISWQQATSKMENFNSIAALVFHINYYVRALLNVLKGTPLHASDKYSFDLPLITSQLEWEQLISKVFKEAAGLIEELPENKLTETFVLEKYGTYYRNLAGMTEHMHYHLGQITLIKKLLLQCEQPS